MPDEQVMITVREKDLTTLDGLANEAWRDRPNEASALLEAALQAVRARANAPARPGRTTSRRPANGVAVAH